MNKSFRNILGCLLLLSFLLNFYMVYKIHANRDYFDLHDNHYIAIDILNELYLSSRLLDQLTYQYITSGDEEYRTSYEDILNQILGLNIRKNQNLFHADRINLFTIIQKNIIPGPEKEKLIAMFEQLLIQTNFQRQAFNLFESGISSDEALNFLKNPIYDNSTDIIFSNFNSLMNKIPHISHKPSPINIEAIFPITGGLFFVSVVVLIIYLYKNSSILKNKMDVEEYINLLVNSMPFVSVIFDNNGKVIGCNQKLLELLDIKSENQFINNYKEYLAPEQEDIPLEQFIYEKNTLIKQNNIDTFNWVFLDSSEKPIPCQVTALYFNYHDKSYFIYYAFNSQKELEMQAKIKEQEERMQIMLDSTPLCCAIWDDNYNIIDCNFESARLFNFSSKQEFIDNFTKISPICQPDGQFSSDKFLNAVQRTFITGYESFEWLHQDLSHTLIPCHVILVRISYRDSNIVVAYTRDLREEKKIFNKLKRKQTELIEAKLQSEKEAKAKSDFLAIMSHEIRTPLNAIINIFGFLDEVNLDAKHKDFVKKGTSSANILLHTINDILDYSKIEAGQLNIEHISFSMPELLDNIQSLFNDQMDKKKLDFIFTKQENIEANWIGDPMRITQILMNLLSNAIKFTDKGSITLKVSKVAENKTNEGTHAIFLFEVIDTGIGITHAQLKKIFTPFMQADTSTTRKYGGTGLGLSISQNLAKLMHGQLTCTSTAGEGSNFKLEIPLELDEKSLVQEKEDKNQHNENTLKGMHILLVEDNQINTLVATELLKKKEIVVDTAVNGIEALKKAQENTYDAILMDIQMPQMDGITATKHMRSDLKLETPIIAMTANVLEEDKKLYMQSGFNAHIGKPIIPAKLYETLMDISNIGN